MIPIMLLSILNLPIYLAIVKAGKLEVTNSLPGQVELMRRNIRTGANSSSGNKTQCCEMRTDVLTMGNSIPLTHIVTHNAHKHSNSSVST